MSSIKDKEARRRIIEELDRTILVEAGAGSGKTRSLVDRMLALLRSGAARIDKMAAVTFTRKAAAELRGRFQTSLEGCIRDEADALVLDRLNQALANLEQCYIGTIHSFCAKILKERPVEAELDPEFVELEEIEDSVFRNVCWNDYLSKIRLENDPILERLDEAGLLPEDLKSAFESMANFPEVVFAAGTPQPPDFDDIRKKLDAFLDSMERRLPSQRPEKGYDGLQKSIITCLIRRRNLGSQNHVILMDTVEILDKNMKVTKNRWLEKKDAESAEWEWERFREETVTPVLRAWREYRHTFVLEFLRPALDYYRGRRREKSRVNYQDSLLLAARLLRKNPKVRKFFQEKYTHILVDEFQDTDPIQAEMLFYLTGEEEIQEDWTQMNPCPGSLFLVGDPKQSIYRFRRADIDIYNLVKDRIGQGGGAVLKLTSNFRSLECLGKWNNQVFRGIFPLEEDNKFQAQFAPMNTLRKEEKETFSGVYKIANPKVSYHKREIIASHDAAVIADWIQWACRGNVGLTRTQEEKKRELGSEVRPEDCMILLRYKRNMELYARALEERAIPFEISGGGAFQDTQEINELVVLARALWDPHETVSTVAALRGLFFGISDRELLEFKNKGGDFSRWVSSSNQQGLVENALNTLRRWREWCLSDRPSTALERICEDTGLTAYTVSSPMGSSRAGNIFKLLDILRNKENEGGMTFGAAAEFLEELITVQEVEEMSLRPGRPDAVRIMNLHKAKGLEAPVVFLANPLGIKPFPPERHIVRVGSRKPKGYFTVSKSKNFGKKRILSLPAEWKKKEEEEREYQRAEEERLLYVASTRAKNALIISTYAEDKGELMAWTDLNRHVSGLQDLKVPDAVIKEKRERLKVSQKEFRNWEYEAGEVKSRISSPSFFRESVTSLAKMEGEAPPRETGDGGMSWGRVVHYVLERLGKKQVADRERLYRTALDMEERDPEEIDELRSLVEGIEKSDLWKRAFSAEQKYFEMPFSVSTAGEELNRDYSGPVVLTGAIDLVFKEEGGWVIADYKTDEIFGPLKRYVVYYAPQIQLYRRFWEKITGETVKESGLYFTCVQHWVAIEA